MTRNGPIANRKMIRAMTRIILSIYDLLNFFNTFDLSQLFLDLIDLAFVAFVSVLFVDQHT
jgi:hypothetical protein